MDLISTQLNLNDGQRMKLKKAIEQGKSVSIALLKKHLQEGSDVLGLTKAMANKVNKARKSGGGVTIQLSHKCLEANKKGGFLAPLLIPAGKAIAGVAIKNGLDNLNADSAGKRRIQDRLNYFRGQGMSSSAFEEGVKAAQQYAKKGQVGSGDFSDFMSGLKMGITDPLSAIELIGSEIEYAVKGKGTLVSLDDEMDPLTAPTKSALKVDNKKLEPYYNGSAVEHAQLKLRNAFPREKQGAGIQFY